MDNRSTNILFLTTVLTFNTLSVMQSPLPILADEFWVLGREVSLLISLILFPLGLGIVF
jgi:hypothetical protein